MGAKPSFYLKIKPKATAQRRKCRSFAPHKCFMGSEEVLFFVEGIKYKWPKPRALRQWLREVARSEGKCLDSLRVILCSSSYLRDLHARYLAKDSDTDVITFNYAAADASAIDGEVYLSLEQLKKQAKEWKVTLFEELSRVMLHGLLHLCGYDDQTPSDQLGMRAAEDLYLRKLAPYLSPQALCFT